MPYSDYSSSLNSFGSSDYYQPLTYTPSGGIAGDSSPWKFSLTNDPTFPETAPPKAVMTTTGSLMYDVGKLLLIKNDESATEAIYTNLDDVTSDGIPVTGEGVLFFNYNYDNQNVSIEFEARAADATDIWRRYKPEDAFDDPSDIKDITDTKTPIALIHNNPDPPDDPTPADRYVVKQLARNNMVINGSCFNGVVLRVFIPL